MPISTELTLALPGYVPLEPAPAPVPVEPGFTFPAPNPIRINLDLGLALPFQAPQLLENEQWDIVKTLTKSDVGGHSRLLIPKHKASLILQELSIEEQRQAQRTDGLRVKVLDVDTNQEVFLTFKVLASSHAHILNGKWMSGFVNRRGLTENEIIGLRYWRQPGDEEGKILFKVLQQ